MSWDAIRGHDGPRQQLLAAERRGRLPHAFLFVGPPGIGKRAFATEFAKALLCEKPPAPLTACDHCPACAQVAVNTHPDFFRGARPEDKNDLTIEVVQEFCTNLGSKPVRGRRKVGILEDVDEFNDSSANCFLKTLEEPPVGAVLILLATSLAMQLPTILSRCQVIRFQPLTNDAMRTVLAENEIADPATLDRLVRLAGGSPGRALELADEELWNFRSRLAESLAGPRVDGVALSQEWMKFVEEAGKEAKAQRQRASLTITLAMGLFRTALRLRLEPETGDEDGLKGLADRLDEDEIADRLDACTEADYHLDRKVQVVLVVESLVDKLCRVCHAN